MAERNYNYDPAEVSVYGKDRMRFELGDTMVEGGADTAALTDAEIQAALDAYPDRWKRAKLFLLESLMRRFAFEVDTRTGPLTLNMQERAKLWREDWEKLKKEVGLESSTVPDSMMDLANKPPYFYAGMQENNRAYHETGGHR